MSEKTYRIGEAAARLNLKTYVLRFWEMEFPQITPIRTEKGQRLYRERDLALLRRIRYLLHERGLTIEGARRILREEAARGEEYGDVDLAMPEDAQDGALHEDETDGDDPPEDSSGAPEMEERPAQKGRPDGGGISVPHTVAFLREESAGGPEPAAALPRQGSLFPAPAGERAGAMLTVDVRMVMDELEDIRRLLTRGGNGDGI